MVETSVNIKNYANIKIILEPDFKTYYNINTPLSYNDIYLYIITGGRGIGKTTGVLWYCVNRYKKYGEQFVYVRRYKNELKKCKQVLNNIVEGVTTLGMGDGAYEFLIDRKRIGFAFALSVQQALKSGIDGSNVTNIVFDEGVLMRGGLLRYLDKDVEMFFELISTIVRDRKNYRIWILGNNLDIFNPYYAYFNIPRFVDRYIDTKRGLYCEEIPTSSLLLEKETDTPLFKLTKGTTYHDYHYNNKILIKEKPNIDKKTNSDKLIARIVYNDITLNMYLRDRDKLYIELKNKIIKDNISYIIIENGKPNYYYAQLYRQSPLRKVVNMCYYNKDVSYNNEKAYSVMEMFMKDIN